MWPCYDLIKHLPSQSGQFRKLIFALFLHYTFSKALKVDCIKFDSNQTKGSDLKKTPSRTLVRFLPKSSHFFVLEIQTFYHKNELSTTFDS